MIVWCSKEVRNSAFVLCPSCLMLLRMRFLTLTHSVDYSGSFLVSFEMRMKSRKKRLGSWCESFFQEFTLSPSEDMEQSFLASMFKLSSHPKEGERIQVIGWVFLIIFSGFLKNRLASPLFHEPFSYSLLIPICT